MGDSFYGRIRKAEEAAEKLKLNQRRCPTCDGAIPGMPAHLTIGDGGVYLLGPGCPDCREEGGGQIAVDAETGKPENSHHKMVILCEGLGGFEDWLEEYGHLRFGGAIDNFLAVYRVELPKWAGTLDLTTPRTQQQIRDAKDATRRFPFWGGEAEGQFDNLVFDE